MIFVFYLITYTIRCSPVFIEIQIANSQFYISAGRIFIPVRKANINNFFAALVRAYLIISYGQRCFASVHTSNCNRFPESNYIRQCVYIRDLRRPFILGICPCLNFFNLGICDIFYIGNARYI